jgi:hypothetical protein
MANVPVTQTPSDILVSAGIAPSTRVNIQNMGGSQLNLYLGATAPTALSLPDYIVLPLGQVNSIITVSAEPKIWAKSSRAIRVGVTLG